MTSQIGVNTFTLILFSMKQKSASCTQFSKNSCTLNTLTIIKKIEINK